MGIVYGFRYTKKQIKIAFYLLTIFFLFCCEGLNPSSPYFLQKNIYGAYHLKILLKNGKNPEISGFFLAISILFVKHILHAQNK